MTLKLNGTNSEAAPAYAGDDADTGLQCGTNELKLVTGGSAQATVDSSGRLLVGFASTTRNAPIQVKCASDAEGITIIGRDSDDIGQLNFYEADKSTNLGEIQYRQDHVNFRHRVGDIRFATGGTTERMRILSNGGLTFNGDTAAANALDDYEEGAFTPTYVQGVTNPGYTLTAGSYTKIGNYVTFTIRMRATSGTGNSSQVWIGGLPFTSSSSLKEGGAFFNYRHDLSTTAAPFMHISAGGTRIKFYNNVGGNWIGTNGSGLINRTLHIQGFYYV